MIQEYNLVLVLPAEIVPLSTQSHKILDPAPPYFHKQPRTGGRASIKIRGVQSIPSVLNLFSHHLLSLLPLMVMYLATNLWRSPKAVRKASGPKKHCSHLDIHKPPCLWPSGGFIKILLQRTDKRMLGEEERDRAGKKKMRDKQEVTAHRGIKASSYYSVPMKT